MKKTIQPKNKLELQEIIEQEISIHGNNCDLNHIDTSLITDMSGLFCRSEFNGDISKWDTSEVVNMCSLFESSIFNGDISKWNVRQVKSLLGAFKNSDFNQSIDEWVALKLQDMRMCFYNCNAPTPYWFIEDKEQRDEYLTMRQETVMEKDLLDKKIMDKNCAKDSSSKVIKL